MAPAISSESMDSCEKTVAVECATINADGTYALESFDLTDSEITELQTNIATLTDLIKSQTDMSSLINLLMRFLNNGNYPILSRLVEYLLSAEFLTNKDIILSQGFSYNINPFKKTSTDFMKPFVVWRYMESSNMFTTPCSTTVVKFDPLEFKTVTGAQIGLLLRFKGIYIHIPRQMPEQSFTFFAGFARHSGVFELPSFEYPMV